MILLIVGSIGAVIVIGFAAFLRAEDRRDDRALRRRNPFPEPDHPGFDDIPRPPEIAHEPPRRSIHELPPLGDAVWHQYPVTSPAWTAPPACPGTLGGAGPGTAAAAAAPDATPPPPAPPPLPDHQPCDCPCHDDEWFPECPRCGQEPSGSPPPLPDPAWACANPLAYPLAWLLSDTFVGDVIAIRGHGGTAGMEAEI